MGQAALKYDEFEELDQVPIPEGGIATFLTAETGSWADDDDDVPPKGITNVVKIADKLAEYGRNEDEYMVHAAEGETVIPMEVFEQNPALKEKIFAEMRIMGIEPERYVVGNELNSINPVTGQPEFFLKKLFKGLKKIVKAVLPVVATLALTAVGLGPVAASAIVSGASTAIQGGSLTDSLKAAAIGGISSFAAGKIGGKYNWAENSAKQMMTQSAINTTLSGGKPVDILKSAAVAGLTTKGLEMVRGRTAAETTPEADVAPQVDTKLSETLGTDLDVMDATLAKTGDLSTAGEPGITTEVLPSGELQSMLKNMQVSADATGSVASTLPEAIDATATEATGIRLPGTQPPVDASLEMFPGTQQLFTDIDTTLAESAQDPLLRSYRREAGLPESGTRALDGAPGADVDAGAGVGADVPTLESLQVPTAGQSVKDIFTGIEGSDGILGGRVEALQNLFVPRGQVDPKAVREYLKAEKLPYDSGAVQDFIKTDLKLGTFRTYGPGAAAVMGLSALSKPEEVEGINIDDIPTGQDLIDVDPSKYRIYGDDFVYQQPRFAVTRSAGNLFNVPAFQPTPLNVAEGGGIMNFPRMNGPIEGPGTETSDDIPAMLSDGEFVFTAKAVRGAGKGSREDGMNTMYQMMRQFEARA
tara:strand:- start:725 stop:2659 length:1935 start_codon:yes stop_codon:yes gene_type:complete